MLVLTKTRNKRARAIQKELKDTPRSEKRRALKRIRSALSKMEEDMETMEEYDEEISTLSGKLEALENNRQMVEDNYEALMNAIYQEPVCKVLDKLMRENKDVIDECLKDFPELKLIADWRDKEYISDCVEANDSYLHKNNE